MDYRFNLLQKVWKLLRIFLCCFICLDFSNVYALESAKIAVASNFLVPIKKLKIQFEKQHGYSLIIISGSTSKLYAQIINGAPFDVFLSADQFTTSKLIKNGQANAHSEFIYACGKLVLWRPAGVLNRGGIKLYLNSLTYQHIAIANPKLAPYGRAAVETLKNLSLNKQVKSKIVYGENIGQTFQFVYSGSAELGFVALSQLIQLEKAGQYWEIPSHLYRPIKQSVVILNRAKTNVVAIEFMRFLKSRQVQELISSQYGYQSVIIDSSFKR